jgi:hypothetical protein
MANTTQIGTATEGIVLAAILKAGKTVLLPFGDQQDYDLVMEDSGCFHRIQCKTGRLRQGSVQFNLYTMAQEAGTKRHIRRHYGEKVDMYGVYCPETEKTYLVPRTEVGTALGVLRVVPPANNQVKNIRWAKDYEI